MIWTLLWSLSWAMDPALLTPSLESLDNSLDRVELLVIKAEPHLAAMGRAQGDWVSLRCLASACDWRTGQRLTLEVRAAGHEARDVVQSVRMEMKRAKSIAESETVKPLLDEVRLHRLQEVEGIAEDATHAYQARTAWYRRYMAGWAWRHAWAFKDAQVCTDDYRGGTD